MNKLADIIQFAIQLPGPLGFLACWALVFVGIWAAKLLWVAASFALAAIRSASGRMFGFNWKSAALVSLIAIPAFMLNRQISDGIEWVEQRYIDPAYATDDTSMHATAIYEAEIAKHVDAYELEIIKRCTKETAAKIGSTPLAIYEVAYSECGLDPFQIRKDGIAAGWIQFTTPGLVGLGTTLDQVKDACRRRDTEMIMRLTDAYLVDRSAGSKLPRAEDVYTCVFAPGHVGKPDDYPLYSGWDRPEYYMNIGLDGYYLKGNQIFRSRSACDGKITKRDLRLALQAKKYRLLHIWEVVNRQ